MEPDNIHERIKFRRISQGLTQQDLGDACGLKRSAISHIEAGRNSPSIEVLKQMAIRLNCSLDYLMGVKESKLSYHIENVLYWMKEMPEEDQAMIEKTAKLYFDRLKINKN